MSKWKSSKSETAPAPAAAYDRALGLLARREHSTRELKLKLALRGYEKTDASEAIDRLKGQHYQSDDRFAESLSRRRVSQGYGPRRIAAELRSHGLSDAAIGEVFGELGHDWVAIAAEQVRRRFAGAAAADAAEKAKRVAFLLRRGFDPATVRAVTRTQVDDPGQDFD
ncbi:MAG: regulatory protein RecX [Dokdonella sp.]|uniref:regulatory protein RecX n=1 Tax=Dokdonella sp. TaxID=2291710 RepID=UPI00326520DC